MHTYRLKWDLASHRKPPGPAGTIFSDIDNKNNVYNTNDWQWFRATILCLILIPVFVNIVLNFIQSIYQLWTQFFLIFLKISNWYCTQYFWHIQCTNCTSWYCTSYNIFYIFANIQVVQYWSIWYTILHSGWPGPGLVCRCTGRLRLRNGLSSIGPADPGPLDATYAIRGLIRSERSAIKT